MLNIGFFEIYGPYGFYVGFAFIITFLILFLVFLLATLEYRKVLGEAKKLKE